MTISIEDQYRILARYYDHWLPEPRRDIDFWLRRAREAQGPVVELGVGTGRVAIEIAKAGIHVTGVDMSGEMLERARAKAAEEHIEKNVSFVQTDFQSFVAEPPV